MIALIRSTTERTICHPGTVVADILEIIEIGEVSGKMLKITNIRALGVDAIILLNKSGMSRGKITTIVAWLPSLGLGTKAPRPAIRLL